MKQFVKQ